MSRRLGNNQEGVVYVEYLVLVSVVAMGLAAGLIGLGTPLYKQYHMVRTFVVLPIP